MVGVGGLAGGVIIGDRGAEVKKGKEEREQARAERGEEEEEEGEEAAKVDSLARH